MIFMIFIIPEVLFLSTLHVGILFVIFSCKRLNVVILCKVKYFNKSVHIFTQWSSYVLVSEIHSCYDEIIKAENSVFKTTFEMIVLRLNLDDVTSSLVSALILLSASMLSSFRIHSAAIS